MKTKLLLMLVAVFTVAICHKLEAQAVDDVISIGKRTHNHQEVRFNDSVAIPRASEVGHGYLPFVTRENAWESLLTLVLGYVMYRIRGKLGLPNRTPSKLDEIHEVVTRWEPELPNKDTK